MPTRRVGNLVPTLRLGTPVPTLGVHKCSRPPAISEQLMSTRFDYAQFYYWRIQFIEPLDPDPSSDVPPPKSSFH